MVVRRNSTLIGLKALIYLAQFVREAIAKDYMEFAGADDRHIEKDCQSY